MTSSPHKTIGYEEALRLVLERVPTLGTTRLPVTASLGRQITQPVVTLVDMPPWTNSAVDGYAVSAHDCGKAGHTLTLIGETAAGDPPTTELTPGTALRVFTGSALPASAAAVVMQEDATTDGRSVTFARAATAGENVRRSGEEARRGETVLQPCQVTPPVIAALVAAGHSSVDVRTVPTVHIVTTGSETRAPGTHLAPGEIHDSNTPALVAALGSLGIVPTTSHVADDPSAVVDALTAGLASDFIVSSGGVSVGDHDHVKSSLASLGAETVFSGVKIKPGKPVTFSVIGGCKVFSLPGNPVSALVTFQLFVRPAILAAMGLDPLPTTRFAPVTSPLSKKPGRTEFVPGTLAKGGFYPSVGRASHKTTCLVGADHFAVLRADGDTWNVGDEVPVLPISWSLP